jgi:putative endonuclease
MYFIYLLRCSNQSLYCGYTTDLARRVYEHRYAKVGAKYTKQNPPIAIAAAWQINADISAVLKLEYVIKQLSKVQKEALVINPSLDNLCVGKDFAFEASAIIPKVLAELWQETTTEKVE